MRLLIAAATIATAALPFAAVADDSPQEVALESRKGFYQMLGFNMGKLAGMAKGDIPYDEAAAVAAATNINALSRYDVTQHFIDGTSTAELGDETEAKPEAISDKAGFSAKFADLQKAADGIAEAVKGGQDKVGPVVQSLGATCKGCHDTYRAE